MKAKKRVATKEQILATWVLSRASRCVIQIGDYFRPFHALTCDDIKVLHSIVEGGEVELK